MLDIVKLRAEVEELVRRLTRERESTAFAALRAVITAALLRAPTEPPFATPTFDLGTAAVPLDQAIALAAQLECEDLLRKSALGR